MSEQRSALDDARDAVLERERLRQDSSAHGNAAPAPWDRRWVAAALFSWALVFWMLLAPAGPFKRPQPQQFSPPPSVTEASLRYGIWLAANRVDRFIGRMHRLPVDLEEVGVNDRILRLAPGSQPRQYTISATVGGATVTHRSNERLDDLLGNSVERLTYGRR